jgi:hypothetical protein
MNYEATDNWGANPLRQPAEGELDTVLFSEHGRIIGKIDYRSHWYKLVKPKYGEMALLVKHGGGEERLPLGHCNGDAIARICGILSPDDRYLLLSSFLHIDHESRSKSRRETAAEYQKAFADGKLKKRKVRGADAVKVWIER